MLLFVGLGLIGAMPVFLLVASSRRQSLSTAQRATMKFLGNWAGVAPEGLRLWIRAAIGSSVSFTFLVALAFTFNFLGEHAMPKISRCFGYFDYSRVEWSEERRPEWEKLMNGVKARWGLHHPEEDLTKPAVFDKWKDDRGKAWVRAPRTLVIFSLLLVAAGLLDLGSPRFRRRGLAILSIGFLSFFLFSIVWANRKEHYIREVQLASETLDRAEAAVPASRNTVTVGTAEGGVK